MRLHRQNAPSKRRPSNPRHVAESAGRTAVLDRTDVAPARVLDTITAEATKTGRPGRLLIRLIRAGWSLNDRNYPAEVLRRDGPKAFPKGMHAYIDHATDEEDQQRPAGSITKLGGALVSDAYWDEQQQALIGEIRLFAPWREAITDMAEYIGVSIRAWVYGEHGQVDGRNGYVVTEIAEGRSVDFVTLPAAGGAILSILESVGNKSTKATEARNVGHWFESRIHAGFTEVADRMFGDGYLTRDERITLSGAVGDALSAFAARLDTDAPHLYERDPYQMPGAPAAAGEAATIAAEATSEETRRALTAAIRAAHGGGDDVYVWLRDYDADEGLLWWERSTEDTCQMFQQSYTVGDDGAITLTGDPAEVVPRVVYDPVPDGGTAVVQDQAAEAVEVIEHIQTPAQTPAAGPVTEGPPPTAPTHPPTKETSVSGTQNTGPAPGAGGAAEGQSPASTSAAEARADLAEAKLAEAQARLTALTEAQTKAATEKARADAAEAELRRNRADEAGRAAVVAAIGKADMPTDQLRTLMLPRVLDRVAGKVPTDEAGTVDATALGTVVDAAIEAERTYAAQLAEALGHGKVRGLGAVGEASAEYADDATETHLAGVFEAIGLDSKTAALAAKGR